jgi:Flp pilus assembly protein TadG
MIRFLRKLWNDRRGNIIVMTAAAMPVLIGAAGLATDTIEWTLWKRQLQRAADSAAIAGVYERINDGGATSNVSTAVTHDLALNLHTTNSLTTGHSHCSGKCVITFPADSGTVTDKVQVTISVQHKLPFSSFFLESAPVISASATAASITTGVPCALALGATGTAMSFNGTTELEAPGCILYSDSGSANAASAGGSSEVTAQSIASVGGIEQSDNWDVDSYIPYSPQLPDPFASLTPDPADMRCAQAAVTTTTTVVDSPEQGHYITKGKKQVWVVDVPAVTHQETTTNYTGAPQSLQDGVSFSDLKDSSGNQANCFSALSVGSNKTLAIPDTYSGPIYINGGNVNLQGNFSCSSCTIVLTNKDTASDATIGTYGSNAQATNNITAPTTGTFAGIAIYQDRRAAATTNTVNGGSDSEIAGAVYFPRGTLKINGSGTADATGAGTLCAMWVANNISFIGNSGITLAAPTDARCSGVGLPGGGGVRMVRLVA